MVKALKPKRQARLCLLRRNRLDRILLHHFLFPLHESAQTDKCPLLSGDQVSGYHHLWRKTDIGRHRKSASIHI
jgi:hypothetical protein